MSELKIFFRNQNFISSSSLVTDQRQIYFQVLCIYQFTTTAENERYLYLGHLGFKMRLIDDFNALPSLAFLTGSRIVITIWNRVDILHSIDTCFKSDCEEDFFRTWKEIEDRVKSYVQEIEGIPVNLLEEMKAIIAPISLQIMAIRSFAYFAPNSTNSELEFPISYWTPYGTVDTKRHEQVLAQINTNDIGLRYNLACNDCFEEIIRDLFPLLTDLEKTNFLKMDRNRELLSYWTHRQTGKLLSFGDLISQNIFMQENDYSIDQFAFLYTMLTGNKSGIEYFLRFLPRDNSELVITNHWHLIIEEYDNRTIFPYNLIPRPQLHFEEAIYFLMSKLNEDKRMEILLKKPYSFLCIFLRYPFFGIFSKYVNLLISELRWQHISLILYDIHVLEKLKIPLFGLELFNNLWHICPQSVKADIKDNEENSVWYTESELLSLLERIRQAEESLKCIRHS